MRRISSTYLNILLLFECISLCRALSMMTIKHTHKLAPSQIKCNELAQSYPVTLISKLFSSVPKREFAIQDLTLSFGNIKEGEGMEDEDDDEKSERNNFILLVGRSASGKTTLLRILSGGEEPGSGYVLLNGSNLYNSELVDGEVLPVRVSPKPVFIDTKPDYYDEKFTVLEHIMNAADCEKNESSSDFVKGLAKEFATILNLSHKQINGFSSALSPSGQYLFGIACACMESSCASMKHINNDCTEIEIPHPVLLLDELLDKETSSIANTVGKGIQNLTRKGAIVLAATHCPAYLTDCADRLVTLSGGKILMNEIL